MKSRLCLAAANNNMRIKLLFIFLYLLGVSFGQAAPQTRTAFTPGYADIECALNGGGVGGECTQSDGITKFNGPLEDGSTIQLPPKTSTLLSTPAPCLNRAGS